MGVMGGFIVGFDSDTPSIFDRMVSFIQKSGVVTAMVGLLTALPETKLYHRLFDEGRLIKNASGNNTDSVINFIPKMNVDTLVAGYKNILNELFKPKNYYKRIIIFLSEYNSFVKGKIRHISLFKSIRIFVRSIFKFGIFDNGRFYFWKMFFWTIFNKPNLIGEAITYSITGFHYRKVLVQIYK